MDFLLWTAIVPVMMGGVEQVALLTAAGTLTVEPYTMNRFVNPLARRTGISIVLQKHGWKRRRGMAVRFGLTPEQVYLQVRLHRASHLSYVRLAAIRRIFTDTDGFCTLDFGNASLHTAWTSLTVARHMAEGAALAGRTFPLTLLTPSREEMEDMARARAALWAEVGNS